MSVATEPRQLTLDGDREVPVSRTLPRDSSRMLRRPRPEDLEVGAFMRKIETALTRAGVEPGDAFYVTRVPPVGRVPLARNTDPQTSKDAARANQPTRRNQLGKALRAIADHPSTADRVLMVVGVRWQRVSELKIGGYVEVKTDASGAPVQRVTSSGSMADVYQITALGRDKLEEITDA